MSPLSGLFVIFAALALFVAIIGELAKSHSPAPSMMRNDISPIGYTVCIICLCIALAAGIS